MEVQLIHEQTYKSQYDLESAVEKFYDSLREEFGMVEDEDIKQFDHISRVFEATAVMERRQKYSLRMMQTKMNHGLVKLIKQLNKNFI